jgi:Cd2+/Zn2+-exporting ATPase
MGARGSAVALETAAVALLSDDLRRLPEVIDLGRRTLRVIRGNVALALVIKGAVLLAALGGVATLWMAVLADVGSTLLVVAYGLTLLGGGRGYSSEIQPSPTNR